MELHSRVFKVALASAVGLFVVIGSQAEGSATSYRYLCTSVPSACEYAPETAPILDADVCWNGMQAYLKGASSCPSGHWPYYVQFGEVVDPLTNQVAAYIPLDDACDMNFCIVKPPGTGPGEEGALCCETGQGCKDLAAGSTCGSNATTVWCHDGEKATDESGSWKCYEPQD